jgi:hypothetical protein
MHIYTHLTSQVSDTTSPGPSSLDLFTTPDKSTAGSLFTLSEGKARMSLDEDMSPHGNKASSAPPERSNLDKDPNEDASDEDNDDEEYVDKSERRKNESDDDKYDSSTESEDDQSLHFDLERHRVPMKLSEAEKERSQLKSSTAQGDRKRKVCSVASSKNVLPLLSTNEYPN